MNRHTLPFLLAAAASCCSTQGAVLTSPSQPARFRIVWPQDGSTAFLDSHWVLNVRYEVPDGIRVSLPGLCGADPRCGHVVVTIQGADCNAAGRAYNNRGADNPIAAFIGLCNAWDRPPLTDPTTVTLELHDDQDRLLTDGAGIAASDTVLVNVGWPSVGPVGISYLGSPQGTVIVPGAAPIRHLFHLSNSASQDLAFSVAPEFVSIPLSSLDAVSTEILDATGAPRSGFVLASGSETNLWLATSAAADATLGDPIGIRVTARTVPPDDRSSAAEVWLTVDTQPGEPVLQRLEIFTDPNPNASDLAPAEESWFGMGLNFYSIDAPVTETFAAEILWEVMPADRASDWIYWVGDGVSVPATEPALHQEVVPALEMVASVIRVRAPLVRGPVDTFAVLHVTWRGTTTSIVQTLPPVVFRLAAQP